MSKIKTLIVIDNLHIGGVATSLYNFLYFAHTRLDICLLSFNEDSIDKSKLPEGVRIIKPCKILHILGKNHAEIKQESFFMMISRLFMIFVAHFTNGVVSRKFLWPFVKNQGHYDLAIAYAQDDSWKSISKGCIDYIDKKVEAQYTAVFIHCDYKNFGGYNPKQVKMLSKLDNILCVSNSCRNSFVKCFPTLAIKTITCESFIKVDDIRKLAGAGMDYPKDSVNFVSTCRLSTVKGLSRTIKAFAKLNRNGVTNFTWTIVGGGPEESNLRQLIEEENLSNKIKMVGNKNNPYPYIKNSSCFLLTSLHEAAPMVFGEAACLGVPVVSTDTCSAQELVQKREIGVVVPNNYEGIMEGVKSFIAKPYNVSTSELSEAEMNRNAIVQLESFVSHLESIL